MVYADPGRLLGISMVACTFSCDTPNLVTQFVRDDGVVKNWAWWAFLVTGMSTVFLYARLWRRSGVLTDLVEFGFGVMLMELVTGKRPYDGPSPVETMDRIRHAEPPDVSALPEDLGELFRVADRMVDNYPYFHPLYAGQMLKPPHPLAAVRGDLDDLVRVGDVELRVDAVHEQVHGQIDHVDVSGSLAVAEQRALHTVGAGHHAELGGGHRHRRWHRPSSRSRSS